MSHAFVNWFQKNNANKKITILAVISLFCYVLMGTKVFGILSEFDNKYMLDLVFYYSGSTFFDTLINIPEAQAGYYLITHYIDYGFIFTFYPMLILVTSKRIKKTTRFYLLAPILAMVFDFLENLIIDIQLTHGVSTFFGSICGVFTALKFTYIVITILLILTNYIKYRRNHRYADI